tara:strand:- start:40387 stop:40539 length:153 start_codon:yes stop_codon:yes gene_type:complete
VPVNIAGSAVLSAAMLLYKVLEGKNLWANTGAESQRVDIHRTETAPSIRI